METLLSAGLSNAVLAVPLAVVVAVLAWLFRRRPAVVHALWLLVLLRFVLPPLWSLSLPRSAVAPPPAVSETAPVDVDAILASLPDRPRATTEPPPAGGGEPAPPAPEVPQRPTSTWGESGLSLLVAIWLAGAVGWWLLAALRLTRFHRRLRVAWTAPEAVQEQARQLARRMGLPRCPQVWLVPASISPLLLALGPRPRLLLPMRLWERLTAEQQETILAHELAHLRRGDPWVRRLELLVLGLYWWHPVAWWAQRRLHEAEEHCCDRWVLRVLPGAASAYATTLVETMAYLSGCRSTVPVAASGLGQVDSLKRRLTMILRDDCLRPLPRPALLLLGLALLSVPLLPGWAEPPRTPPALPGIEEEDGPGPASSDASPSRPLLTNTFSARSSTENAQSAEDLQEEIELLRAQLAQAEADLKSKQATLDYRSKQYERMRDLVRRGAVEERLVDQERDRRNAAEGARDAAVGQVAMLKMKLKHAEGRLARRHGASGPALQELRDTVELLEAQVAAKQAELKAAEAGLASAERQLKRFKELAAQGAIEQRILDEQLAKTETRHAELEIRRAALLEPAIRLKHARRRLEDLETGKKVSPDREGPALPKRKPRVRVEKETETNRPPTNALTGANRSQADRMQNLEKKLNEIAEELKALRREMDGRKTPPPKTGAGK